MLSMEKRQGFSRIYKATFYSYRGLRQATFHEAAFRQELVSALILIPLAFFVEVTLVERILLIGSVVLVLIVELLNTAIEAVVDRIGFEHHPLAGQAKDIGSAAVFVSILLWAFTWGSLLYSAYSV